MTVGAGNFKLRKNNTWGEEYTGTFVEFGTPFAAGAGADNITLGEENVGVQVIVTLDTNAGTVTIDRLFDGRWGVVGAVNGMTWNGDVLMWQSGEVWKSAPFRADGEFKIRKDGAWDVDRGGEFAAFDTAFAAAQGGKNISLGEDAAGKVLLLLSTILRPRLLPSANINNRSAPRGRGVQSRRVLTDPPTPKRKPTPGALMPFAAVFGRIKV